MIESNKLKLDVVTVLHKTPHSLVRDLRLVQVDVLQLMAVLREAPHAVVRGAGPPQGMPPPPPAPSQQAKKEALGRLGGGGGAAVPIGAPYEVVDLAGGGTGR